MSRGRPHMSQQLIWTTDDLPVHFEEDGEDKGTREIGTTIKNGSYLGLSNMSPVSHPATIGPTALIMRWSCRGKSTWRW